MMVWFGLLVGMAVGPGALALFVLLNTDFSK